MKSFAMWGQARLVARATQWGKKGRINDTSLVGVESNNDDTKVTADEVAIHFVHMHPHNREFLDAETDLGRQ